jgi:hypothetical protein
VDKAYITQYIRDFFRLTPETNSWTLSVGSIGWRGPHEPYVTYHVVCSWQTKPTDDEVEACLVKTTQDTRFFTICTRCNTLNAEGHMHRDTICQSCAERYLGVVH